MASRKPFDPSRIKLPDEDRALFAKSESANRWTVKEFNERVRNALRDALPATIHVVGEIGDLSRPASGHLYFTLKDADSELRCVMWRSAAAKLKFKPEVGLSVVASGPIDVYVPRGTYQLNPRKIEPVGVGALELAFRQLREKLAAAGLFDRDHKIALPRYPNRIAVITSGSGAALHDITDTMRRRHPGIEILLFPVRVQGDGAAAEIAQAIAHADRLRENLAIDAIIVGRGGGSLEDLWAFNEEVVARAIYECETPIVSAVGHEVDISIADLVADVRAATPTAAAELLAPDRAGLLDFLNQTDHRLRALLSHQHQHAQSRLLRTTTREPLAHPLLRIREAMQEVDDTTRAADDALTTALQESRDRLRAVNELLRDLATGEAFLRARARVQSNSLRCERAILDRIRAATRKVTALHLRTDQQVGPDKLQRQQDRVTYQQNRAHDAIRHQLRAAAATLAGKNETLAALNPRGVLERGYALVRDSKTRRILKTVAAIRDNQRINIELTDGEIPATAQDPNQPRLFE